jgi:UDP-3-O-[3-hydroxymyristoyl] glucosamine N-acyltransferase
VFTFRSAVLKSVTEPKTYSGTLPAEEAMQWRRNAVRFRKLDELAARVTAAERLLEGLAKPQRQRRKKKKKDE